jgi:MFS family permease
VDHYDRRFFVEPDDLPVRRGKKFGGLFVTRIGVGVGEAALSPPAYSLLSDYFEPSRLAVAPPI